MIQIHDGETTENQTYCPIEYQFSDSPKTINGPKHRYNIRT